MKNLFYILYSVALTVFFLYYLFPSEPMEKFIVYQVRNVNPKFDISMDRVIPSFPPGLNLTSFELVYKEKPIIEADKFKVMADILALIKSQPVCKFRGNCYEGKISGKAFFVGEASEGTNNRQFEIHSELEGIQIKDIKALNQIPGYRISGKLEGKVHYTGDRTNGTLFSQLNIINGSVEFLTPLFTLENLLFNTITADIEAEMNNQVKIKECVLKGNQIDGTISGTVNLMNHRLDLDGSFKPHPSFLAKLSKSLPISMLFKQKPGDSGYPFKIGGTIQKPNFSLK